MSLILLRKQLRDLRLALIVLMLLLVAFEWLWAKIMSRVVGQLLPMLIDMGAAAHISPKMIEQTIFDGPGRIVRSMIGGENISMFRMTDMMTVGYMHTVVLTILCLWAVGRAAGAIAGELDRGTMELLLAQPLARLRIIVTQFCIDLLTIPLLCLSLWVGNWLGIHVVGVRENPALADSPLIDAGIFGPALWNVGALVFAMTGYTLWLSAAGRFRWKVLGLAIFITLIQYVINVVAQLWETIGPLRQFTVFYYYQPQEIILNGKWSVELRGLWGTGTPLATVNVLAVLFAVGLVGYAMAAWTFCKRDLPAPL